MKPKTPSEILKKIDEMINYFRKHNNQINWEKFKSKKEGAIEMRDAILEIIKEEMKEIVKLREENSYYKKLRKPTPVTMKKFRIFEVTGFENVIKKIGGKNEK